VVCIEEPRLRSSERLTTRDMAMLHSGNETFECRILDISLGGARLAGRSCGEPGTAVTIALDDARFPGRIVRCGRGEFAVRFDAIGAGRADLIRLIYSGRFSATVTQIKPAHLAAAVFGRVMR
jgi:cellulose synthase (UDP-forming)